MDVRKNKCSVRMWTLDRVIAVTWTRDVVRRIIMRKKTPAASWTAATRLVKFGVIIFAEKKVPAASWRATGLVKSWVVIFLKNRRLRQAG